MAGLAGCHTLNQHTGVGLQLHSGERLKLQCHFHSHQL